MIHTAFDVMKEYMITGAELDGKYQFPVIPAAFYEPGDTIDFADSFKRSIKNHRELNVNFYIHDNAFVEFEMAYTKALGQLAYDLGCTKKFDSLFYRITKIVTDN